VLNEDTNDFDKHAASSLTVNLYRKDGGSMVCHNMAKPVQLTNGPLRFKTQFLKYIGPTTCCNIETPHL
jgi:hypothetical protein